MSKDQLEEFNKKQLSRLPPEKREAIAKLLKRQESSGTRKTMAVTRTQLAKVTHSSAEPATACSLESADLRRVLYAPWAWDQHICA